MKEHGKSIKHQKQKQQIQFSKYFESLAHRNLGGAMSNSIKSPQIFVSLQKSLQGGFVVQRSSS